MNAKKLFIIIVMLTFICCLCSCNSELSQNDQLNEKFLNTKEENQEEIIMQLEDENIIKKAYLNEILNIDSSKTINDINILKYFGKYSDCYVALIMYDGEFFYTVSTKEAFDGDIVIQYNNSNMIKVLYNDQFYTLKDALDKGYLCIEDIKQIAQIYKIKD